MYYFYFDASALVKRYTEEISQRLLRAANNEGLLTFNPEIDIDQTLKAWLDTR